MSATNTGFKPSLGLLDATMIVAGSMIGSGIFIVSADIARNVGSSGWLILVWLIAGFMTITAALGYGELSGMFPKAGGQYVYLKEAYNPLVGFLYGWSFFAVIQTATIAAVGVAFSKFLAYLIPSLGPEHIVFTSGDFNLNAGQFVSIALIFLLTYINTRGIQAGKFIQNLFTGTKLIALFALIFFGFMLVKGADIWAANWTHPWVMHSRGADGTSSGNITGLVGILSALAAAMVGSIFSSDAWNNVTFIAGEVKNPHRNIGLSLFLGTLLVTIIYTLANLMYTYTLPLEAIASAPQDRVAVAASKVIFGDLGTAIIAFLIMVSTFGCNNGLILSGARVYYTMAQDGLFFRQTALLNKNGVPEFALWIQFVVASLLCLSGKYGDLLDMISLVAVMFYAITIWGIFRLRKKRPDAPRPYRAFGYPVLPVIYILMAITFCLLLIKVKPQYTWPGLIIVLTGIPIYYFAVNKKNHS
jgi:APA family basic amino acid/polyamine antiporter